MAEIKAPKDGNRRRGNRNGQPNIAGGRWDDAAQGQPGPDRWGALVRDALAIYITLALIVMVAIAQLLYWKLVIAREDVVREDSPDLPDMDWLRQPVDAWVGFEAGESEPALVGDPVLAGV
jgi:hypothetical protein